MSKGDFFVRVGELLDFFMSILSDFFQTVFGGHRYSTVSKSLSHEEILRLISQTRISSLTQDQVKAVEDALIAGRNSEGKISLSHIDEVLKKLEYTRKISKYDREQVVKVFQSYLGSR